MRAHSRWPGSVRTWLSSLGEQQLQARALNLRGNVAKYQGEFGQAARTLKASLVLFRALHDHASVAMMLNNLATLAQERGEYAQARTLQEESLALKRSQDDQRGIAVALLNLGDMARDEGQPPRRVPAPRRVWRCLSNLGDEKGIALALNNLGEAALLQGDYEQASACVQNSLKRSERMGDHWIMAVALHNRGRLAWARGKAEEAERAYQQSWQVSLHERSQLGMVECLEGLIVLSAATDPARGARLYGLTTTWRAHTADAAASGGGASIGAGRCSDPSHAWEKRALREALADGQATALEEAFPS